MSVRALCLIALCLVAGGTGCSLHAPQASRVPPGPPAPAAVADLQVAPSDDRLGGVLWTQTSAEYRALALAAFARARVELDRALADRTSTAALEQQGEFADLPPAVIADVDETLLDNSPYEADRIRAGGRYESVSWGAWVNRARATPVPGALEFARYAAERGVTLFYVTNRAAPLEEKTRVNLEALGFPLATDRDTVLVPGERPDWSSEKSTRRAEVASAFRILLLIGDDLGDFVSGCPGGAGGADGARRPLRRSLAAQLDPAAESVLRLVGARAPRACARPLRRGDPAPQARAPARQRGRPGTGKLR